MIGTTACGAVIPTEGSVKTGEMPGPHLDSFVDLISPAVEALPAGHSTNDAIENVSNASYQATVKSSRKRSTIANLTATGDVGIVPSEMEGFWRVGLTCETPSQQAQRLRLPSDLDAHPRAAVSHHLSGRSGRPYGEEWSPTRLATV